MTKRCWFLFAGSLVACVCLVLGAGLWILPELQPPVFYVPREKFASIEEGMTETEVEAILGQPGTLDGIHPRCGKVDPERWMTWQVAEREWAIMGFQNDRVSTGTSWRVFVSSETMLEKIRRWLQLS
jgi:hypothetical protein